MAQARHAPGSAEPEAVRVRLMNGFGVSVGSRSIDESSWRLRKAGSLVKLLALAEGHRLHREQVAASLWPELDAKSAANNLYRALHFARKALEPAPAIDASHYLTLRGDLLSLCPDSPRVSFRRGLELSDQFPLLQRLNKVTRSSTEHNTKEEEPT